MNFMTLFWCLDQILCLLEGKSQEIWINMRLYSMAFLTESFEKWTVLVPPITAAAAKLLQSCPTLCDPIDGSPPGSPVPGILQARTLEWVAISFNAWKWKVKSESEVTQSCLTLSDLLLFHHKWPPSHMNKASIRNASTWKSPVSLSWISKVTQHF